MRPRGRHTPADLFRKGRQRGDADCKEKCDRKCTEQPAVGAQTPKQSVRHAFDIHLHREQHKRSHNGGSADQCGSRVQQQALQPVDRVLRRVVGLKGCLQERRQIEAGRYEKKQHRENCDRSIAKPILSQLVLNAIRVVPQSRDSLPDVPLCSCNGGGYGFSQVHEESWLLPISRQLAHPVWHGRGTKGNVRESETGVAGLAPAVGRTGRVEQHAAEEVSSRGGGSCQAKSSRGTPGWRALRREDGTRGCSELRQVASDARTAGGSTMLVQPGADCAVESRQGDVAGTAAFGDVLDPDVVRVSVGHSSVARVRADNRFDGPVDLAIVGHSAQVAWPRPYQSPRWADTIEEPTSPSLSLPTSKQAILAERFPPRRIFPGSSRGEPAQIRHGKPAPDGVMRSACNCRLSDYWLVGSVRDVESRIRADCSGKRRRIYPDCRSSYRDNGRRPARYACRRRSPGPGTRNNRATAYVSGRHARASSHVDGCAETSRPP